MNPVYLLSLAFLSIVLTFSSGWSAESPSVSPSTLKVVGDNNYPPFLFIDPSGNPAGYVVDWWHLWEQKTGVHVELTAETWAEAQKTIGRGEADVIDNIFRTPPREPLYDFTKPYIDVPVAIYSHVSIPGIQDVTSLRGFLVGVMAGDACIDMLRQQNITFLKEYPDYTSLIKGAMADDVKLFCLDEYPANYYLYRLNAQNQYRKSFKLYEGKFHRAVRKGNADTLRLVEKGAALISSAEDDALRRKWFTTTRDYSSYFQVAMIAVACLGGGVLLLLCWVYVMRVTVRRKTSELRESEDRFRRLFEDAHQGFAVIENGRFIDANRAALNLLRLSDVGQIRGLEPTEISPHYQPDGRLSAEKAEAVMQAAFRDGSSEFEWQHCRANGELFDAQVLLSAINQGGRQLLHVTWSDITERKKAEEEKDRLQLRLQSIMLGAPVGISIIADRRVVWINRKHAEMFQYSMDEIIGRTTEFLYPSQEDFESLGRDAYPVLSSGGEFESIRQMSRKDGSTIWVHFYGKRIDPVDASQGSIWVLEDITEIKTAEAEMTISEKKFRNIFEYSLDACLLFRTDRFIDCNRAAVESLHARSREDVINMSPWEISPEFQPDGMPSRMRVQQVVAAAIEEGGTRFEWIHRRLDDGSEFPVEVSLTSLPDGLIYVVWHDISERKQYEVALLESNQRFYSTFMNSPTIMAISNLDDGTYYDINNRYLEMTECTREEVVGSSAVKLGFISAEDRAKILEAFKATRQVYDLELNYTSKSGRKMVWLFSGHMITLDGTEYLLSSSVDITGQKQMEQQLYQAQKMESVGRLAGGVAHDFNNMLSVILGHAEMAMMSLDSSNPLHERLTEIHGAAERSAELTRQLLAFARKQVIAPKILNLNETISALLKILKRLIGEDIQLTWQATADIWNVKMDPSQIDQVLANLCVNAKDAISGNGRISIEVCNSRVSRESSSNPDAVPGDYVRLSVSDNGCGIEPDVLKHIFEPFFTTKALGEGTGLGLATVFGIVKQNNGFIDVVSEIGSGTAFYIYLPRAEGCSNGLGAGQESKAMLVGSETILLVEDEPAMMNMISTMLQLLGYKVLTASSPFEALRVVRETGQGIDLLITDVIMPEMNGIELSKEISFFLPRVKCLFMSGYTADIIARQGIIPDSINFLQKPFTQTSMAEKIRRILSQ